MNSAFDVIVYHNPECGASRDALALIRHAGFEPHVIEYLKTPPTRAQLVDLAARSGRPLRALIRERGTPFAELGLADPALSDDELIDAMLAHPILINRPLVVTPLGVDLCRPSDIALDLLPRTPLPDFTKEDGEPALRATPISGDAQGLAAALAAEGLPTEDLKEPGRRFFVFHTLSGRRVGYGGFEPLGPNALLRSIVVLPDARRAGVGKAILGLLARHAFNKGAREAWLFTNNAAPWFGRLGFAEAARETAPATLLATRQASGACAAATLLRRAIRL